MDFLSSWTTSTTPSTPWTRKCSSRSGFPPLSPLSTLSTCTTSTFPTSPSPPLSSWPTRSALCRPSMSATTGSTATTPAFFPSLLLFSALSPVLNWNVPWFRWETGFSLLSERLSTRQSWFLLLLGWTIGSLPDSTWHGECPIEHSMFYQTSISLNSSISLPYFAAWLILYLISLAPSSILHTWCPRWSSNMRQDGQIMLSQGQRTSSIEYSSTRRLCCADCTLRYPRVNQLRVRRPFCQFYFNMNRIHYF